MKHETHGDQWKEGHAVTEIDVFYRIYKYVPIRTLSRLLSDCNHAGRVNSILLGKGR